MTLILYLRRLDKYYHSYYKTTVLKPQQTELLAQCHESQTQIVLYILPK